MTDTFKRDQVVKDTPEEREFELRAQVGSVWTGGRLFIGMYTFLLASLVFSYFYLRSSNNQDLWRPHHVTAPTAFGWTIYSLVLLCTFLVFFGQMRFRKGLTSDWILASWVGVGAGLVALFFQIYEYTALPFYPGSSGYASTYIGYSIMNIITLAVGTYWLETTVARVHRLRRELGSANAETSSDPSARLFRANLASMTYFWGFIALSSTLLFAMFYLL